ncbi:hypothetical protein Pd630_LPD10082 (plasmid) [Rhodococcus opacus PD630]|nr:hypothetical protein Pd630_LPD10082 [Rhodococcus opacus PD630]
MGMWVWAAEGTTKTSWDYLLEALTPMVALVGVIAVAWVGIRTARKGPYDRLDTLVKVLDTWPTWADWPRSGRAIGRTGRARN